MLFYKALGNRAQGVGRATLPTKGRSYFFMFLRMNTLTTVNQQTMKKIAALGIGIAVLAACQLNPKAYTINATVTGALEGTQVYLKTTDTLNQRVTIDTTTIAHGAFSFSGIQHQPKLYYISTASAEGSLPLVLENETIAITFQKDSLTYAEITGSVQNKWLMDLLGKSRNWSEQLQSLQKELHEAAQHKDTATARVRQEAYVELQEDAMDFSIAFVEQHPDALVSVMLLKNFLASGALPEEDIAKRYTALSPQMKASPAGTTLKKQLDTLKTTAIGAVAPEFSAPNPEGKLVALSDIKGKLTLIDFWAAWCLPCRTENPYLVKLYHTYHHKGLHIIGVSLDTQANAWKKAIAADGLPWNQVSNLKEFKDPIAKRYNVNAIPANVLLDENGVIIAKNLRGGALEEKVAEQLP